MGEFKTESVGTWV